jgi:hypothetical protein
VGNYEIHPDEEIFAVNVSGPLVVEEILHVIDEWYPRMPATRILWDLTQAEPNSMTQAQFGQVASAARAKLPFRPSRKTAYVVADISAYMFIWKYVEQAMAVKVGAEYSMFTDRGAAERWLRQP